MRWQVVKNMLGSGWLGLSFRFNRTAKEFYRMCFLARAGDLGLLRLLARGPMTPAEAASSLGLEPGQLPALEAFLDMGVAVGELRPVRGGHALKGRLAKSLAEPGNDAWQALASEIARLHAPCMLAAPGDARARTELGALTVSLSSVIARSSRVLEPLMRAVVTEVVPERGPCSLLEVGCGSGVYVLGALERNPELTVTALEREEDVFLDAQERIARSGHAGRCRMVHGDVRSQHFDPQFDCITLYNNIYYFPESERTGVLATLRSWLKPGGRLALTTICHGGGPMSRMMMLWSRISEGAGSLPEAGALAESLRRAGFERVRSITPVAGESFTLFLAGERPV